MCPRENSLSYRWRTQVYSRFRVLAPASASSFRCMIDVSAMGWSGVMR